MNLTPDIAQNLVNDPPPELQKLMADPRTTDEARQAVASLVAPSKANGTSDVAQTSSHGTSGLQDGRLQVVNEGQEFTLVSSSISKV